MTGKPPIGIAPAVGKLFGQQVTEDFRGEAREAFGGAGEGFVPRNAVGQGEESRYACRSEDVGGHILSARTAQDDGRYAVGMCERGYMAGYLAVETLAVEPPLAGDCERSLAYGRVGTGQRGNGGRTGDEVGSAESFQRPGDAARSTASGYRAAVVPGRRCGFRGEVFRSRFE